MSGYAVYQRTQNATQSPRDVEYRLLGQVTSALMAARDNPRDIHAKVDALQWNRDVWSAFRVDLAGDDNGLPRALRASLISLSLYIERECIKSMAPKGELDELIELNRTIMEGLRPAAVQAISAPSVGIAS